MGKITTTVLYKKTITFVDFKKKKKSFETCSLIPERAPNNQHTVKAVVRMHEYSPGVTRYNIKTNKEIHS